MELTGKWRYQEEYGYGMTEGELVLTQEGEQLSGRIILPTGWMMRKAI